MGYTFHLRVSSLGAVPWLRNGTRKLFQKHSSTQPDSKTGAFWNPLAMRNHQTRGIQLWMFCSCARHDWIGPQFSGSFANPLLRFFWNKYQGGWSGESITFLVKSHLYDMYLYIYSIHTYVWCTVGGSAAHISLSAVGSAVEHFCVKSECMHMAMGQNGVPQPLDR